jgi:hypothetical protein
MNNKLLIKTAEILGMFKKVRIWLQGKKTIISAIGGMFASGSILIGLFVTWIDNKITTNDLFEQGKIPAGTFWVSLTFLFAALHPENINKK